MSHILTGVLAMVCGLAGAWAFASFAPKDQEKPTGDDPSRQAKKDSSESQAKKQDDAPSSEGDDKLREQIRNLSTRFEALRQRVETLSMPRDMNSPDLTAVRVRVDEFSRSVDGMKELPGRFRAMETRLDRLVDEMKGRPNRPADPETKTPVAVSASPEPPPPAPPADPSPSDGDLAAGMALFKESKYPEAEAKFRELQRTRPEDARVWYFSALSVGLTTGQWDGEARTFVIQGADRERAGLPATSVIDSALAELNPKSGKDWLASYRSQLLKR
jgi:TolA-binding protein